jgi:hypothetical protein
VPPRACGTKTTTIACRKGGWKDSSRVSSSRRWKRVQCDEHAKCEAYALTDDEAVPVLHGPAQAAARARRHRDLQHLASVRSISAERRAAHWRPGSSSRVSTGTYMTTAGQSLVVGGQAVPSQPAAARERARSCFILRILPSGQAKIINPPHRAHTSLSGHKRASSVRLGAPVHVIGRKN